MHIKITIRYHLTPVLTKIQEIASVNDDVEKREPLGTVGGNVNWHTHYENQYGDFSKN